MGRFRRSVAKEISWRRQQVAKDRYASTIRKQCARYIQKWGWRACACSIRELLCLARRMPQARSRTARALLASSRRLYSGSYRRPPMPPSICSALPLMNPDFFGSARKATNCCPDALVSSAASTARLKGTCLSNLLRLADAADGMELR